MSGGKEVRQTSRVGTVLAVVAVAQSCVVGVGNQTPPAPRPEVSWLPTRDGGCGMSSRRHVGQCWRSLWKCWRLFKMAWIAGVRRMQLAMLSRWPKASWRRLNKLHAPGIASAMDHNSPMIWCHFWVPTRHCVGDMPARMDAKWSHQCWGRAIVMACVSRTQPSTVLLVLHAASPVNSFLTDMGSLWWGLSSASRGWKTSLMVCKRWCSMAKCHW